MCVKFEEKKQKQKTNSLSIIKDIGNPTLYLNGRVVDDYVIDIPSYRFKNSDERPTRNEIVTSRLILFLLMLERHFQVY